MRAYWEVTRAEIRRSLRYPAALIAGIVPNTVFGFIRSSVLVAAVVGAGGQAGGYDPALALSYVWLGQFLIAPIGMFARNDLAQRVKSGEVAVDLARPVDFQLYWWARDMGRFLIAIPIRGLPTLIIGMVVVGIAWPPTWASYPLGVVSVLLATSLNHLLIYLMNLISFWVVDVQGYLNFYGLVLSLMSGFILPVTLFPDWLRTVAEHSPFPSCFQTAVDVLSGRLVGGAALGAIMVQLGWLVGAILVTRVVFAAGARRLVVQGG